MDIYTMIIGVLMILVGAIIGAWFGYQVGWADCLAKNFRTPPQVRGAQERLDYGAILDEIIEEKTNV